MIHLVIYNYTEGLMNDLFYAVRFGSVKDVKRIVSLGTNVNQVRGKTPLLWAIERGSKKIVKILIAAGAHVNRRINETLWLPLRFAMEYATMDMVKLLLNRGADPNCTDEYLTTPFLCAIYSSSINMINSSSIDMIKLLLEKGANPNYVIYNDICVVDSPLLTAVEICDKRTVKLLIKSGADVNMKNKDGSNILTSKIWYSMRALNLLIDIGEGSFGKMEYTDIMHRCIHSEAGEKILKRIAPLSFSINEPYKGKLLLLQAIRKNVRPLVVQTLLRLGADIYGQDKMGQSAILMIQTPLDIKHCEVLSKSGFELTPCIIDGHSGHACMIQDRYIQNRKLLLKHIIKVEARTGLLCLNRLKAEGKYPLCNDVIRKISDILRSQL